MSEILTNRLRESIGREAIVFLKENLEGKSFRYSGKITNCDENYLELLDYKTNSYKLILLENVKDIEVNTI